jgi:ankyrin repeat protein
LLNVEQQRFFQAIRRGDACALREIVEATPALLDARCPPVDAPDEPASCTGLHVAARAGRLEAARVLIDAGIDLETRTEQGRAALHDAIECGEDAICELLIESGAEVDVCAAAILGRVERLHELLERDPALANDRSTGLSPLGWAAYGNRVDSATLLLDRGARMDDGELLCAASVGHVEVGRLLLDRGADPNAIDRGAGGSALHAAVAMRYTHDGRAFVRMLLDHGADPALRSARGETAAEIAERRAREPATADGKPFAEIAEMLRAAE